MLSLNLRHFRVFIAVVDLCSLTAAAARANVTQPAVTQAIGKIERELGCALFTRTSGGLFPTPRGKVLLARLRRAMGQLDDALTEISPRLRLTATAAQLKALIAVADAQNFSLAARTIGLAQPTVHRAVTQLEQEAGRPLFERTSFGLVATRTCRALVQAARLAFSEIGQAGAEQAEIDGREVGRIVIGALPLARSVVLPEALAAFRKDRPRQLLSVIDGPYDEMLAGLRRGDIDMIIGALRDPLPVADIVQEALFDDRLTVLARPDHPLAARRIPVAELLQHGWVVPRSETPSRIQFDALFASRGLVMPESILECGSILLMRELLAQSDLLGCISARQAEAEIGRGSVVTLETDVIWPVRPIGLTMRTDWLPTRTQTLLLNCIRDAAKSANGKP